MDVQRATGCRSPSPTACRQLIPRRHPSGILHETVTSHLMMSYLGPQRKRGGCVLRAPITSGKQQSRHALEREGDAHTAMESTPQLRTAWKHSSPLWRRSGTLRPMETFVLGTWSPRETDGSGGNALWMRPMNGQQPWGREALEGTVVLCAHSRLGQLRRYGSPTNSPHSSTSTWTSTRCDSAAVCATSTSCSRT